MANYYIEHQVLNYQSKVVGLIVNKTSDETESQEPGTYIPCYPSSIISHLTQKWMDDDTLWSDYETTRNKLLSIHKETKGEVLCFPKMKLLDDGMIVGIITETNQFVPISPISENIFDDGLIAVDNHNYIVKETSDENAMIANIDNINNISYLKADNAITTLQTNDTIRQTVVSNIDLETKYYTFFRSIIRKLLIEYDNRENRKKILAILDNPNLTYREKLDNIISELHDLVGTRVLFVDMDERTIKSIQKQCMNMSGKGKMVCFTDEETGQVMIPSTHLIGSRLSNEQIYYGRMADELIRYTRIKLFMLSSSAYLNIGHSEYVIYDNELLLLQSLLNADYFKDIVEFNNNKYLKNINYQNAIPLFSQKYQSQPITVEEQRKLIQDIDTENDQTLNMEFVKEKLKNVQGHPTKSLWGRLFYTNAQEYKFYATARSSFYMLVYIFGQVLRNLGEPSEVYTIDNIKDVLLRAYAVYFEKPGYKTKIMTILNTQGKGKLFKGNATFEQVVKSDSYYVTDLDIWVISNAYSLPIVLFSSTSIKSLFYQKIDWVILGGNPQVDTYYFVRSPTKVTEMEYQLILPGVKLTAPNMNRFYSLYQAETIKSPTKAKSLHLQSLDEYLTTYQAGPIKKL
jgi:hypothetical protein